MAYSNSLVLSLLVLGVAVIVFPHDSLAQTQKCRKGGLCEKPSTIDEEVWTVRFGLADSRYAYWDPITEEARGHYIDVTMAVCRIAGRTCLPVNDISTNCWDTLESGEEIGGVGLFNHYYDACGGWHPTYPRLRTLQFSNAITKQSLVGYIVQPGNPDGFVYDNLEGQTIGFIDGFFTNPTCVLRETGFEIPEENIVLFEDHDALVAGVVSGAVDAGFERRLRLEVYSDQVEFVEGSEIPCAADGPGMMMRKDNLMKKWFDPALEEFLASDEYAQLCDNIEADYGDIDGPGKEDICLL